MAIVDIKTHALLLIEKAARGGKSGTLADWPQLKRAMISYGIHLRDDTPMDQVSRECQECLAYRALLSDEVD